MRNITTKTFLAGLAALAVALTATSCGGALDSASSDAEGGSTGASESSDLAAAAAGSLFSGSGANASMSALTIPRATLARFVEEAQEEQQGEDQYEPYDENEQSDQSYDNRDCGEDDPECTCAEVMGELEDTGGPDGILMGAYGDEGYYGSFDAGVDLAADDFCAAPDGTENAGLAFDGKGRFATFELGDEVGGTCVHSDGEVVTIAMLPGSTGVWRNTEETEDDPAYAPEIYGSFTYLINGEDEITLNCTIFLDANEGPDDTEDTIVFADCSDENGTVVETDGGCSCELSVE